MQTAVDHYAKALTAEQLKKAADFYATPAGRALTGANLDLNESIMRLWQDANSRQVAYAAVKYNSRLSKVLADNQK